MVEIVEKCKNVKMFKQQFKIFYLGKCSNFMLENVNNLRQKMFKFYVRKCFFQFRLDTLVKDKKSFV